MALPPARHPVIALLLVAVLTGILAWVVLTVTADTRERERLDALAPFYVPPDPLPDEPPGTILRSEPLGVQVQGGRALRMLYVSETGDGRPRASSGRLFIPDGPAPPGGRPVVAWAHGTIGLGDQCTPSKNANPIPLMPWVEEMLARGWVVAATDYAGLGTPGASGYLISAEESRDVINSVRAARDDPSARASTRWLPWGHSQGGHAALAAGAVAPSYAPELDLQGVATAAPAAELRLLLDAEWNTANAWVIGSEIAGTWPEFYPGLQRSQVLTSNGENHWQALMEKCITSAAYNALFRQEVLRQDFFRVNPWQVPDWRRYITQNTARTLPASVPLFVAQSTTDTVVLPGTTAAFIQRSCATGERVATTWIADVSHQQTAIVTGPSAVQWMEQVFAGRTPPDDCGLAAPVAVASPATG
jgi:hypothetical protein